MFVTMSKQPKPSGTPHVTLNAILIELIEDLIPPSSTIAVDAALFEPGCAAGGKIDTTTYSNPRFDEPRLSML
jgi:hypothetical protein